MLIRLTGTVLSLRKGAGEAGAGSEQYEHELLDIFMFDVYKILYALQGLIRFKIVLLRFHFVLIFKSYVRREP